MHPAGRIRLIGGPICIDLVSHGCARVSALGCKTAQSEVQAKSFRLIEPDVVEPLIFRLAACSDEDLLWVAQVLEDLDGSFSVADLYNVKPKNESPWRQLNVAFLQTLS